MQWWLTVFFYINGSWVPGDQFDGWAARTYGTEALCIERKAFAEKECRNHPLQFETYWMCTEGAPAKAPPFPEPDIEC